MKTAIKTKQTKQPKATKQAEKPTEEKILTAKDLAQMAGVTPTSLRKTLRQNFSGKIPRGEGDQKNQYRVKSTDPLVKEIIAKAKAGNNHKETPVKAKAIVEAKVKVEAQKPTPSAVFQSTADEQQSADKGEGEKPSPESLQSKPTLKTLAEIQASREDKEVK